MAVGTKIEWTEATWSPVTGCTSAGCDHCYAVTMTRRLAAMGQDRYKGLVSKGHFNGVVHCHEDLLEVPMRWKKQRMIFVNSMSDLFHPKVPFSFVALVYQTMAGCPLHTFQILTKRPEQAAKFYRQWWTPNRYDTFLRGGRKRKRPRLYLREEGCDECRFGFLGCLHGRKKWKDKPVTPNFRTLDKVDFFGERGAAICDAFAWDPCSHAHGAAVQMNTGEISVRQQDLIGPFPAPLKNVWLGTSIEDQPTADERTEYLRQCPAAVRFLSVEPLLGLIERLPLDGIHWIIVGGESGPRARPMNPDWVRSIRDQCQAAGVPFFFRQWGAWMPVGDAGRVSYKEPIVTVGDQDMRYVDKKVAGRMLDGRTWDEMPITTTSAPEA